MGTAAEHAFANVTPPRRGECLALEVDATARPYDLRSLPLAGFAPKESKANERVFVTLQALTADVWFYFASVDNDDLDPTADIAAGQPLAYADTYGDRLAIGSSIRLRIDRQQDKFLVVRTSSGTATLLLRASSESFGD